MAWKEMTLLAFVAFSLAFSSYGMDGGKRSLSRDEDLELDRRLMLLNKPATKSIHTKYGDIFDCVDINKQPAFDHPLLSNHTLQDPNTGNWWLVFGKDNKEVGYWPKSLFSSLSDFASLIGWVEETYSCSISPSPPMGSGRLPKEGYRKACYQRQLQLVDETNSLRDPLPKKIYTECDQPK